MRLLSSIIFWIDRTIQSSAIFRILRSLLLGYVERFVIMLRFYNTMNYLNHANKLKNSLEVLTLLIIDVLSVIIAFKISLWIRIDVLPLLFDSFPPDKPFRNLNKIWWIFLVWFFFFYYEGLYTKRLSFWDEIKSLWRVSIFSTAGIFIIVSIAKLSHEISRTVIIIMGTTSLLFFPLIRMTLKKFLRHAGLFKRRVLILGAGKMGTLILNALQKEPNYGYEVVGFLDDDPKKTGTKINGVKVHRGVERAVTYLKSCNIADVFIAMPQAGREKLQELINHLQHKVERILFVPDMFGIAVLGTSLQHFFHEQAFALELKNNLAKPLNILVKRCFDLMVSILLLPFLAIPFIAIAILIKMDSSGPAIFQQTRIGKKGKTFKCFKFRTMYVDAENRLSKLLKNNSEAKKEWDKFWKLRDDPRITKIGRFLRSTSLDELPQIFNVLKGEMSLVGPRPVVQEEIDRYYKDQSELCFSVPPGITGLWQVSGRSNTSYEYRVGLDAWYVRNWNVWLDIVMLFKTVGIVLKREGAY